MGRSASKLTLMVLAADASKNTNNADRHLLNSASVGTAVVS